MNKATADKIEKFVLEHEYAEGDEKRSVVSTYDLLNYLNSLVSEPVEDECKQCGGNGFYFNNIGIAVDCSCQLLSTYDPHEVAQEDSDD